MAGLSTTAPTRRSDSSCRLAEPNRRKLNAVGLNRPSSIPIVVVLPEPFGPSRLRVALIHREAQGDRHLLVVSNEAAKYASFL